MQLRKKCETRSGFAELLPHMVSLSGDLEPCLPASLLKFRHVRRKVDHLTAILQAGVGSLKLTLVAYPSARDIAFILSQWQLPAAGCSSQLFTMCCKLAHNFYFIPSFTWKFFFVTLHCLFANFPFDFFYPFALFRLSHVLFHLWLFKSFPFYASLTSLFLCVFNAAFEQPASQQWQATRVPAMILF